MNTQRYSWFRFDRFALGGLVLFAALGVVGLAFMVQGRRGESATPRAVEQEFQTDPGTSGHGAGVVEPTVLKPASLATPPRLPDSPRWLTGEQLTNLGPTDLAKAREIYTAIYDRARGREDQAFEEWRASKNDPSSFEIPAAPEKNAPKRKRTFADRAWDEYVDAKARAANARRELVFIDNLMLGRLRDEIEKNQESKPARKSDRP